MPLVSINPATGQRLHRFPETSALRVQQAVARSAHVFSTWRNLSPIERANHVGKLAKTLRTEAETLAALATSEVGKPITQSRAEVEKCALTCEYYARNGPAFLEPQRPVDASSAASVSIQPLGPILAVMPWNFPFWQVFRAAIPALVAGNTVLLKHAGNVCGCALAIEEVFRRAGFPGGALQALLIAPRRLNSLVADARIRGLTLTGSTGAGQHLAALAGAALKPCVLELGGSDAYLILGDADIPLAAEACAEARLINAGQSCVAAKRFIVVDSVRKAFEEELLARVKARRQGDPLQTETDIGPLAREDLRTTLHRQVKRSLRRGATLLLGGEIPEGHGFYYPPTILTDVVRGMPAFEEELFGPVAAIVPVRNEEAAIAAANASRFGLGAAIFTRDRERGEKIGRERLEAGMVFVNSFVRSDPTLPFGGIKDSGFGRELGSWGVYSFANMKTIWVQ